MYIWSTRLPVAVFIQLWIDFGSESCHISNHLSRTRHHMLKTETRKFWRRHQKQKENGSLAKSSRSYEFSPKILISGLARTPTKRKNDGGKIANPSWKSVNRSIDEHCSPPNLWVLCFSFGLNLKCLAFDTQLSDMMNFAIGMDAETIEFEFVWKWRLSLIYESNANK